MLIRAEVRSRIYRRHNERYAANWVLVVVSGGAGIRHDGRTALVEVNGVLNAQIYRDEMLQHHGVPLINVTDGIF